MKYIFLISFTVFVFTFSCANAPSTAEQAATAAASCLTPVLDGTVKSLSGACRVSSEEEHIRLEGVSVSAGKTLTVWTSSNTDRTSAYRISFNGTNGRVTIANLAHGGPPTVHEDFTLSTSATYCFDLHGDENPAHVMMWKNTNCDVAVGNNLASAEFESENCGGTGCTLTNWNAGDTKPSGSGVYYQADSVGVTLTKIRTNTPRHSD